MSLKMALGNNFALREFTKSQAALRLGLDNAPDLHQIRRLEALVDHVLQPVRDYFGRPVQISSGFRAPAVNKAIGGASSSQHTKGEAADFEVSGESNLEIARFVRDKLEFDQLILEYYTEGDPSSGWVHVSFRAGKNRAQVFTKGRGTPYREGLPES